MQGILFILTSICVVTLTVPAGYFLAFIREVGSECNTTVLVEWVLIASFCGVGLILYIVTALVLFRVREEFEPLEEEGDK